MISQGIIKQIESMASAIAEREGCFLYDLEFTGAGQGRILRVFIDKDDVAGVGIDECSRVSNGLNLLLDVEDIIPGGTYHLEVSSPGLERALKKPWHFEKSVGKKIWSRLRYSFGDLGIGNEKNQKQKQVEGMVTQVVENKVSLDYNGEKIEIPIESIEKAHVVYDFSSSKGKKQ